MSATATTILGGDYVYGTVAYSGVAPTNTSNVTGGVTTPFTQTVATPTDPTGRTANSATTTINGGGSYTITGGSQSSPTLVNLSILNVSGGGTLTLEASGTTASYIQVWVSGDFVLSGGSTIVQQPNVHVTYYVDGKLDISGGSISNQTNIASNNVIFATGKTSTTATISGGSSFTGAIDAPTYDITISGGASNFYGAFVGNSLTVSGGASIHYDSQLKNLSGSGGTASGYIVGSWVEVAR